MSRDLSDVFGRLGLEDLTGTRRTGGAYDSHGKFVPGSTSSLAFQAMVQPLTDLELQRLPEGFRTSAKKKIYTTFALIVEPEPDVVTYQGVTYQVAQHGDWVTVGGFNRFFLVKVQAP